MPWLMLLADVLNMAVAGVVVALLVLLIATMEAAHFMALARALVVAP